MDGSRSWHAIEYTEMEVGIRGSVFKLDCDLFGHLCKETRVEYMWKFIFDPGMEIENDLVNF